MKVKIKICGMRDHENIMEVAGLGPDLMGFIFYRNSPRYVGDDFTLPPNFPAEIKKVGVFVNDETPSILRIASALKLDFIQMHGSESPQQCAEIRHHNYQIIKTFSVANSFDSKGAKFYLGAVDFFLFDTKGNQPGGNGRPFDWGVLDNYDLDIRFFLSGGLNVENARSATRIHPLLFALDLNSGVEKSPANKDPEMIKAIKTIIR